MAGQQSTAPEARGTTTQVTLTLPADLVAAVEEAVRSGHAASSNQLMVDALRHELAARATAPAQLDLLEGDVMAQREDIARRFGAGVERTVAGHLASSRPIFFAGTGSDAGKLIMRAPDGRRFECQITGNDSYEVVRELPR